MHSRRMLALAGTTIVALSAALAGVTPARAVPAPAGAGTAAVTAPARDQIQCPRGYVCIYPDINYGGQPYVKRAVDGSVRHLPDYIRGHGSSIINNSSRTARVYQKDNYFGRHVCVGRDGGTIHDLRSYGMNDTTHSLRNNDTPCGA
ncbi:peptidase inhibitor family I36 protein [Actinacidiphila acididurans]|uniref:Peptidase inhibitor family I36 protein n=1 Tax=Actinacidiphila acididurans TaxID=2784346 RepID=A0ABS2TU15_9ACTN|nr:peptidase inhibitor family I36 protein [Actinacidiphila acididurans]MBM9506818.1 peptidase inhibitor family I36 protein [Actinacidiphila acididurans]